MNTGDKRVLLFNRLGHALAIGVAVPCAYVAGIIHAEDPKPIYLLGGIVAFEIVILAIAAVAAVLTYRGDTSE